MGAGLAENVGRTNAYYWRQITTWC